MAIDSAENRGNGEEHEAIVAEARRYLDALPEQARHGSAEAEGDAISGILAPFEIGGHLQAAVLIYPTMRDYPQQPAAMLSSQTAALAAGLVQLSRFSLPLDWRPGEALATPQSEALRKMLLAMASDARLVLVRIAEQLYRLRAAKSADPAEQQRLALETREIYAPLASRLGIWQLKWELEDLAFRYLDPSTYRQIASGLRERRSEREAFIETIISMLKEALSTSGIHAEISGRPKHIYSIWRKMQRKDRALEQIFDMRAVRIFVNDIRECYAALGVVHNLWPYLPGEFDDYIANPKDNLYRSLHTAVVGPAGKPMEVQIRTKEMHHVAEYGIAA
ncbi:MAG: bifunctional (p)ppGpp synthetase/guanosine-3',5'-bis(diphosphate) 3'-pyrophosphohydrolase, partial [Halioglobus sp.]|nr:bifunctional (p)ppGpp synthetase/guanosine-3',5'-bis(diphosphate) 3'-pyrophosphohydrolase [Halioglobus sp.]